VPTRPCVGQQAIGLVNGAVALGEQFFHLVARFFLIAARLRVVLGALAYSIYLRPVLVEHGLALYQAGRALAASDAPFIDSVTGTPFSAR
jgi:hypothetical protein